MKHNYFLDIEKWHGDIKADQEVNDYQKETLHIRGYSEAIRTAKEIIREGRIGNNAHCVVILRNSRKQGRFINA
jgi:hypothetical protein